MDTLRTIEKHLFGRGVGQSLAALWRDDRGVTAIEYGLIAALIAVAAVTVMGTVGSNLSTTFNTVATNL
jgi:pilus assembly protein Flp/PilA